MNTHTISDMRVFYTSVIRSAIIQKPHPLDGVQNQHSNEKVYFLVKRLLKTKALEARKYFIYRHPFILIVSLSVLKIYALT